MNAVELEKAINSLSPQQLCDFKCSLEMEASKVRLLGQETLATKRHTELAQYCIGIRQAEIDQLLPHEKRTPGTTTIVSKYWGKSKSRNGRCITVKEGE